MKLHMFSVYDSKAFAFLAPFFLPTPEMAIRTFRDCAFDPSHMFCKHSEDFNLYHMGEYDDSSGQFESYEPMVNLGLASTYKNQGE